MKKLMTLMLSAGIWATSQTALAAHVLVVLSDAERLDLKDGKSVQTGFYFNELMQPVKMLLDANHKVTFATPLGRAPMLDQGSLNKSYFGNDEADFNAHKTLLETLKLTSADESPVISLTRAEQMGYQQFDALYVPGGRAPMQDLTESPLMGRLLANFNERGKPTAMVCHGPAALLSTLPDPVGFARALESTGRADPGAGWIYAGYNMTVMSNTEEKWAQRNGRLQGGEMKYMPQTALEQAGGRYRSNLLPWSSNMVVDRELITGQNPESTMEVANELLKRLK
ncbi:type 1 glutamine amidotransferase domain-containing protein [Pseudomonas sp. GM55]|uniref:type 1 glutamine amidotransferase domain-containing protein n=1 Tax=Pseudomonas sp. GM55 TaxID=1144333 RepID=UPI0002708F32|nr:type 1 glutamine amidotransferase domain-containing protein [Pseudomonas sp. GM55]EJM75358.1 putative intracellular protease/amidase [Pseudomonas sp. GM55]